MGVRILANQSRHEGETGAVLFCSTSGWAFGPVFNDYDAALDFCEWFNSGAAARVAHELGYRPLIGDGRDPRAFTQAQLEALYNVWFRLRHENEPQLRVVS